MIDYKNSNHLSFFTLIVPLLLFWGCATQPNNSHNAKENLENLQEGDLLFQDLNCGELCDAIEAVTEGVNGKDFSHCAMVVKINDSLKVVEAIGDKVQVNTLKDFFARSGDTASIQNITVGRVFRPHSFF
jgi:hypothetical protein